MFSYLIIKSVYMEGLIYLLEVFRNSGVTAIMWASSELQGLENSRMLLQRYLDSEDERATFSRVFCCFCCNILRLRNCFSSYCDSKFCFVLKKLRTHKFSLVST